MSDFDQFVTEWWFPGHLCHIFSWYLKIHFKINSQLLLPDFYMDGVQFTFVIYFFCSVRFINNSHCFFFFAWDKFVPTGRLCLSNFQDRMCEVYSEFWTVLRQEVRLSSGTVLMLNSASGERRTFTCTDSLKTDLSWLCVVLSPGVSVFNPLFLSILFFSVTLINTV